MGNIRRIKKKIAQAPLALVDTTIAFNKCKVFLASPSRGVAKQAAGQFAGFMQFLNERARIVNIRDLYEAHFKVLQKIEAKESILN